MLDLNEASRFGGPYIVTNRIAESDLKNDFDFTFLTFGNDGKGSISISRLRNLVYQIKDKNPDLVHFSGLQLSGFMIALACLFAGNYRSLMTIRGTSADALDLVWYKKVVMAYVIEPLTCLLTKKFYCNSNYTEQRAISRIFSFKRYPFVYNFWGGSRSKSQPSLSREALGFSKNDVVIVSTGRITRDKGFSLYCEIIELVLSQGGSSKFLLVGDGSYLETVKTRLSDYIEQGLVLCLGFREDVSEINLLADIYLNPSLHETLSISTMEAMSAGLAAVVTDDGGLKELVVEGKTGFRCEAISPSCYAERLMRLSSSVDLRKSMGRLARERIATSLSEASIAKKLSKIYSRVLDV